MNLLGLCVITGIPILIGLAIIFKEAGWPSERERTNRALRSFWTALGATPFITGLAVLVTYESQPGSFIRDLSILAVLKFIIFIVVPTFCIVLAGSFVQYWSWGKTELIMRGRLRKIAEADKRRKDGPRYKA